MAAARENLEARGRASLGRLAEYDPILVGQIATWR